MEAIDRTFFWPTGDHITRESLTLDAKILSLSLIFSHILQSENGFIEVEKFQEQKPSGFQRSPDSHVDLFCFRSVVLPPP